MSSYMIKKTLYVTLFQAIIYLILFIVLPGFLDIHPSDSSGNGIAITLAVAIVSLAGMFFIDKIRYWSIGIPIL